MLFIVSIYVDGYKGERLLWQARVDAEDREGAIREAMTTMAKGYGYMGRFGLKHMSGDVRVEVDAVERRA